CAIWDDSLNGYIF
nr:immunoglobulin light chain junction region [Macaca mulatta]